MGGSRLQLYSVGSENELYAPNSLDSNTGDFAHDDNAIPNISEFDAVTLEVPLGSSSRAEEALLHGNGILNVSEFDAISLTEMDSNFMPDLANLERVNAAIARQNAKNRVESYTDNSFDTPTTR